MNRLGFNMMSVWFKIRDWLSPPEGILAEVGIEPGCLLLDYGCGPGSYSVIAAQVVGPSGKVFAVDINRLALQRVQRVAEKKGLSNIETIRTDCATGVEAGKMDVVLLYDTYHDLKDADGVLKELHRILKPNGILSFSDHHMKERDILAKVPTGGLFALSRKGKKTYTFLKQAE